MKDTSAFDELAEGYDTSFTHTFLGTLLREAVWGRLDALVGAGDRVLELGCGTGEDAVFIADRGASVLATDASGSMVDAARQKAAARGLADRIEVRQLSMEGLGSFAAGDDALLFDGALSNFGGMNCVADLGETARSLADRLHPGAWTILCVMGPWVPWEWGWYLARGEPAKAFRRLRREGTTWRNLTVRYPAVGVVRKTFAPLFHFRRASALGALLPPTYAGEWAARHKRFIRLLNRIERRIETWPPVIWSGDHYVIELERR